MARCSFPQPLRVCFTTPACSPSAIRRAEAKPYIASMGIYVMQAKALRQLLMDSLPDANDFGNEIIPGARKAGMKVQAYAFQV